MSKQRFLFLGLLSLLMLSACVPTRKYKEVLTREQGLIARIEGLTKDIADLNARINDGQTENSRLISQIDAAGKNNAELARLSKMTQEQLEEEQNTTHANAPADGPATPGH
jgi:outer membrane murein-binding lipoprotein Lpp